MNIVIATVSTQPASPFPDICKPLYVVIKDYMNTLAYKISTQQQTRVNKRKGEGDNSPFHCTNKYNVTPLTLDSSTGHNS
jgi:hypothetical protein